MPFGDKKKKKNKKTSSICALFAGLFVFIHYLSGLFVCFNLGPTASLRTHKAKWYNYGKLSYQLGGRCGIRLFNYLLPIFAKSINQNKCEINIIERTGSLKSTIYQQHCNLFILRFKLKTTTVHLQRKQSSKLIKLLGLMSSYSTQKS